MVEGETQVVATTVAPSEPTTIFSDENDPSERALDAEASEQKGSNRMGEMKRSGAGAEDDLDVTKMNETADNEKSLTTLVCTNFKYVYSTLLLLFSLVIVVVLILDEQTALSQQIHPVVALVLLFSVLCWLSLVEGGQGALVGLAPVDKSLYALSHPIAHQCTTLAHKSSRQLDRYLIGRQFLVIFLVFVANQCGAPVESDASVLNLPTIMQEIFVRSSLCLILVTAMMGQLHSQVNGSNCMLDYINNRFMLITLRISLALEASGFMHTAYLLQFAFAKLSGKTETEEGDDDDDNNNEEQGTDEEGEKNTSPPKKNCNTERLWFWGRVAFSLALLGFSFAVTLTALFNEQTNMWKGVPVAVSVILFFSFMIVLGILEGTQIAVFAVSRLPMEELARHPKNVLRCVDVLLVQNNGQNLPRFMIGRQIMVTILTFITARVTTINVDTSTEADDTIWGVPPGVQEFFNTGLLGAIIVTLVGSISWRLVGSAFPVLFLSNPLVYILIQTGLALEASGICSGAWVLAGLHRKCAGFQRDTTYLGTLEEQDSEYKTKTEGANENKP